MASSASAQINVRIDRALKDRGDKGLAAAGLSPSESIRMLYAFAARHQADPNAIVAALAPSTDAEEAERERRLRSLEAGYNLSHSFFSNTGLKRRTAPSSQLSGEALKAAAYAEKYGIGEIA